ncbi:MAG: calcium-binding protein [Lentisphaerota bacterium]
MNLDGTGISVEVSDLHLGQKETMQWARGVPYRLPAYSRAGAATITGSENNDTVLLTQDSRGDTVLSVASQGRQASLNLGRIASLKWYGRGGDDTFSLDVRDYYGGVILDGGEGNDTMDVTLEKAFQRGLNIQGQTGNDILSATVSDLSVSMEGGAGNDQMTLKTFFPSTNFTQQLYGQEGNDYLQGGMGHDALYGGDGEDRLFGGEGNDVLHGGNGDDFLSGDEGQDILAGESGADQILGGPGDDLLLGGPGNDQLFGGSGRDTLRGGDGTDMLAPAAQTPEELYAYDRIGDHLKVLFRGTHRFQPVIMTWRDINKVLLDYSPTHDWLADARRVV